jgi:hypothetical protein
MVRMVELVGIERTQILKTGKLGHAFASGTFCYLCLRPDIRLISPLWRNFTNHYRKGSQQRITLDPELIDQRRELFW